MTLRSVDKSSPEALWNLNCQQTLANMVIDPLSEPMIWSLVDLTLLNETASMTDIDNLVTKAVQNQVAAICVYPHHLTTIPNISTLKRATVANFPTGNQSNDRVLANIHDAITQYHADEIDYVFPYQIYLAGQTSDALAACHTAYQLCKQHQRTFKVIMETGAFPSSELIYQLSLELIHQGCDFLKTSTGKITTGATIPAAFAILSAIHDTQSSCGIKISGGIKTYDQARQYVSLAQHVLGLDAKKDWFRIGTSGL
ncbi:MAG: deoxyribose-phosphate aldolase [Legionellaceae bacterium]|nr:deoxyribose-phosphate aldolase [Legionellaceae bacterium]